METYRIVFENDCDCDDFGCEHDKYYQSRFLVWRDLLLLFDSDYARTYSRLINENHHMMQYVHYDEKHKHILNKMPKREGSCAPNIPIKFQCPEWMISEKQEGLYYWYCSHSYNSRLYWYRYDSEVVFVLELEDNSTIDRDGVKKIGLTLV